MMATEGRCSKRQKGMGVGKVEKKKKQSQSKSKHVIGVDKTSKTQRGEIRPVCAHHAMPLVRDG